MSDLGYGRRFVRFWGPDLNQLWWLLLGLPALYFFQTFMHEGSHALAALFATGDFPKFAPYPHVNPAAGFRNGVTFSGDGFVAMPQFLGLTAIIALTLIFILWPIRNHTARLLLKVWFVGACIDLLYNTGRELIGGHNRFADWSKFQDEYSVPTAAMVILTLVIWLLVFSHFAWVYISAWVRLEPARTGFWDYRWVAMTYGILSFLALMFAIFVGDPSIDKSDAVFIIYVVMQIAALAWYWIYFGLTFRRG